MISAQLKGREFLRVNDWSADELLLVLDLADRLKARQRERVEHRHLEGRTLGMIFQKPSTRTRVSFEVGSDVNLDQVFTQNRLAQANSQLPASVVEFGTTVQQTVGLPLLVKASGGGGGKGMRVVRDYADLA